MVLVTSLLATPVMAENNFGVDLESMSLEDLISLKDAVNERIAAKGGDNVIGQGTYVVGTDIKAANFKITPLSTMSLAVFRNRTFAWYWRKGGFKQIHEWYNHQGFDAIGIDDFIHISEYLIQSTYG